jgi:hypothetical protein
VFVWPRSIALLIEFQVDANTWSAIELHVALVLSCTPAFKALIQRFVPGFLGSHPSKTCSQFPTGSPSNTFGGGYVIQSLDAETSFGTATTRGSVDKTASQEHIIDDVEMAAFENTDSIRSPSKASTDGGALGGHSVAVVVST